MGFWRNAGYIIAIIIIAAGVICFIAAIVASPRIETQPTEIGNITALAGVSSLALIGFGGMVSGIILIWALKKSGQIESMEKSLRKIANGMTVIESFQKERLIELEKQKERLIELEKQKEDQKTVYYEKDPEKSST
ncbi:MAG: hypothetical protein ABR515_05845 [Nitrososphaeraceae archaeon]